MDFEEANFHEIELELLSAYGGAAQKHFYELRAARREKGEALMVYNQRF